MIFELFFISLLLHIIDDFVLQPVCLSKLKQKEFWEKNAPDDIYKYDYIAALVIHGLSWSIMVMLPYIACLEISASYLVSMITINAAIHSYVDHLKANKHEINLIVDQSIHLLQIVFICCVCALI